MKNEAKTPSSFQRLLRLYGKITPTLVGNRHRALLVISGSDPLEMAGLASKTILYHEKKRHKIDKKRYTALYVYHDEFDDAVLMREAVGRLLKQAKYTAPTFTVYEKSEKYLGTTFSYLIMDLTKDLKPNDLGRLVGIVEGGGLVILLTPPWREWDQYMTIFKRNLTIPQFPQPRHIFISWIKRKLLQHQAIGIYDSDERRILKKISYTMKTRPPAKTRIPDKILIPRELYKLALTQDQVEVIKLMELLYEKPRRDRKKTIVITADRGRGKSSAIGIGSVGLIHLLRKVKPKPRILVTAPKPSNIGSLMDLAMKALDTLGYDYNVIKREGEVIELRSERFSIEYWEPINIPKIKGDIVVVDEAAGIHVPMLYKIWEAHRRLIFSSTIHGYEGAGRGFSVRFLQKMRSDKRTILYEYEMTEPIRYSTNDPVEKWQFDALLLDAEPAELSSKDLEDVDKKNFTYVEYEPSYLFSPEGEEELRQLFGIYVLAHYRNEPDDLGMIADAPHHIVRAVKTSGGKIVCAVQIAYEGGIDEETAKELLRGGRIPGNIIPDRMLKHLRIIDFASLKGWRIVRIATHPQLQGRGIGSWVLRKIASEAMEKNLDWVAAGFGVNARLLRFWVKNNYYPVHISPDRNPVSGEYTLLVIHPLSREAVEITRLANKEFRQKIIEALPINYRDMELGVAAGLLGTGEPIYHEPSPNYLTRIQLDRLWIYCLGPMTFEAAADLMHMLARLYWSLPHGKRPVLNDMEEKILVGKALQGKEWEEMKTETRIPLKRLHMIAHEIACKFFKYLVGMDHEEYEPGVKIF